MRYARHVWGAFLIFLSLALMGGAGAAQSPFSAAVTVNNRAVTYWEISQRERFLELLNAPPEAVQEARETLINERLQVDVAERLGLTASIEEVEAGMQEFAARADLSAQEFITQIEQVGVAGETFRDFVTAGVTWRNVVRARFGPRAQVTEAEIDRAMASASSEGGTRLRLAEIIIAFSETNEDEVRDLMNRLSRELDGDLDAFAEAALRFSTARTAANGGAVGWRSPDALPPEMRGQLLAASPGDVTTPGPAGNGLMILQLLERQDNAPATDDVVAVEYALIPVNSQADAAALQNDLDTCDDLFGVRPDGFTRSILPVEDVPGDIAGRLDALDDNEFATGLSDTQGQPLLLMLCGRSNALPEGARENIRQALFQRRLATYASGFLAELRAEALITEDE